MYETIWDYSSINIFSINFKDWLTIGYMSYNQFSLGKNRIRLNTTPNKSIILSLPKWIWIHLDQYISETTDFPITKRKDSMTRICDLSIFKYNNMILHLFLQFKENIGFLFVVKYRRALIITLLIMRINIYLLMYL
jgi:hypothetical protein